MAIIQRRVFYGKVGTADELVGWANDMYSLIKAHNPSVKYRILSDHQSGRTDRVATEIEAESMAELDSMLENTMSDDSAREQFGQVFSRLGALIEYAEVEQWTLR